MSYPPSDERAAQGVAQGAVVVDDQDAHPVHCGCRRGFLRRFLRRSYAAPTHAAGISRHATTATYHDHRRRRRARRSPPSATAWAPRRATALPSPTTRRAEQDGSGAERGGAPPLAVRARRAAGPRARWRTSSAWADRARCSALRDYHDQHEGDRRDEFAAKLAKALGVSTDKVKSAFEGSTPGTRTGSPRGSPTRSASTPQR